MTIETAVVGLLLLYGSYQILFTIGYLLRHKWRLYQLHHQVCLSKKSASTISS